jgi:excisionase family DNA binding protein
VAGRAEAEEAAVTQRLLTVREVANRVGLSEWAVRRAIHNGELVAFKPRGRLRVAEVDLEDWLNASRVRPTPRDPPSAPCGDSSVVPAER